MTSCRLSNESLGGIARSWRRTQCRENSFPGSGSSPAQTRMSGGDEGKRLRGRSLTRPLHRADRVVARVARIGGQEIKRLSAAMDPRGGRESTFVRERLEACGGSHPCGRRSQGSFRSTLPVSDFGVRAASLTRMARIEIDSSQYLCRRSSCRVRDQLSTTMGRRICLLTKGVNRSLSVR